MENQKLNIEKFNVQEFSVQELNVEKLVSVNGGSQWSDDLCYYAGVGFRMLQAFSSRGAAGSANRFA